MLNVRSSHFYNATQSRPCGQTFGSAQLVGRQKLARPTIYASLRLSDLTVPWFSLFGRFQGADGALGGGGELVAADAVARIHEWQGAGDAVGNF